MTPTKSFHGANASAKFVTLSTSRSVYELADRSREAGLAFVGGARTRWGRLEIGRWLLRAYSVATLPPSTAIVELRPRGMSDGLSVDDAVLAALARDSRRYVIDRLRDCTRTWNTAGFASDMVDGGLVVGVCDGVGAIGYVPIDNPTMRLRDRVASLFVADFLTRPRDYASLIVCDSCDEVSFEWEAVHRAYCERAPESGFVVRHEPRRPTYSGLGLVR